MERSASGELFCTDEAYLGLLHIRDGPRRWQHSSFDAVAIVPIMATLVSPLCILGRLKGAA